MSDFDGLMRLTKQRLVQARFKDDLVLFKYHRKVFYDHLWDTDPLLLQARGHVYSIVTKQLVINPFDKVFNYGESSAGLNIPDDHQVIIERKVNGFMAAVTWHHDDLLVTSTGSFDSPFVDLARKHLGFMGIRFITRALVGSTIMFEICDPSDPHIIEEKPGPYLIGYRLNDPGSSLNGYCYDRDEITQGGITNPSVRFVSMKEAIQLGRDADHEGFMIKDAKTFKHICKIKSRKYLGLKLMARSKKFFEPGQTKDKLKRCIEEEFYPIIDQIFDGYGQERFLALPEQDRLDMMRNYL